jgi:hypothetical protein
MLLKFCFHQYLNIYGYIQALFFPHFSLQLKLSEMDLKYGHLATVESFCISNNNRTINEPAKFVNMKHDCVTVK